MSDERIGAGATRGKRDPKHTPGPWQQSHRKTGPDSYSTQVYTSDGEIICTLHWYPKPKDEHGGVGTYRDANARLIAAAPDLLAALKDLVLDIESTDFVEVEVYQPGADFLEAANAAISKAEGKP